MCLKSLTKEHHAKLAEDWATLMEEKVNAAKLALQEENEEWDKVNDYCNQGNVGEPIPIKVKYPILGK